MTPKTKRLGHGKYRMHSGDEYVTILRAPHLGGWIAQIKGSAARVPFKTKWEASEWAFDWLTEHA